jgi:hypothetical protein
MDLTMEQHQILCRTWKKSDRDPGSDLRNVCGRTREPYTGSPNSPRQKEMRRVKSKVRSMLIIFFDIKGIVHKEFILVKKSVSQTTVTFTAIA